MRLFNIILLILGLSAQSARAGASSHLLNEIEKKYQNSFGIQMDVVKRLKIQLLDKEKKSEGVIKIKEGGLFKWEVNKPDKSTVLLTPTNVWVIDYPVDEKDKMTVLKSRKPKKSQSPAVVAFLMGQGSLSKNFKILDTKNDGQDLEKITLQAKSKDENVQKMNVVLNKKTKTVQSVSFEDNMGNLTELEFKNVIFDVTFEDDEFTFDPPKDAAVSTVD